MRMTGLCSALAIAACTLITSEAHVETVSFTVPSVVDPSPAHCHIDYVAWPHQSESVPGAIKVNATKDKHTFRGAAMGTSWEGGKPFVQFLWGAPKEWPCGY